MTQVEAWALSALVIELYLEMRNDRGSFEVFRESALGETRWLSFRVCMLRAHALLTLPQCMMGAKEAQGRYREYICDTTAIYQPTHSAVFWTAESGPSKTAPTLHLKL